MIHTVKDWMSSPVVVIDPDSSVSYALTLMRRRDIRSLVVPLEGFPTQFGIITTTDIRDKLIAFDRNPAETTVRQIMTTSVITARQEWSLKECSLAMQEHRVNHLPVVDATNNLVGMISTTDLFMAAEEVGWEEGFSG